MRSHLAAILFVGLGLAALPACSKKDKPATPAAASATPATPEGEPGAPPAGRTRPIGPPAPPVDCNAMLTAEEASAACGQALTMQPQPDEGKGRARRVSCARVFTNAAGQRLTFRIQSDPRGDSVTNVKSFTGETQFPRNWDDVQAVPNLGDGARRFVEKAGMALGKGPRPGGGGKHLRFVKGIWRVSLQAGGAAEPAGLGTAPITPPAPAAAAAPDLCGFDQLETIAHKIVDRLPPSPPPPAPGAAAPAAPVSPAAPETP